MEVHVDILFRERLSPPPPLQHLLSPEDGLGKGKSWVDRTLHSPVFSLVHDLVLDIVPTRASLDVLAEGMEFLGGHVAELALFVGDEAGPDRGLALTELRGLVGVGVGLDETGVVDIVLVVA